MRVPLNLVHLSGVERDSMISAFDYTTQHCNSHKHFSPFLFILFVLIFQALITFTQKFTQSGQPFNRKIS